MRFKFAMAVVVYTMRTFHLTTIVLSKTAASSVSGRGGKGILLTSNTKATLQSVNISTAKNHFHTLPFYNAVLAHNSLKS